MKPGILFFISALFVCGTTFAQKTIVKGTVKDSITHVGEPYASIRIFKQENKIKPIAMSVTDRQGHFQQQMKEGGNYVVVISSIGRKDITEPVTLKNGLVKDLGILYISDNVKILKGITVTAQKPLVKMEVDKMTYDVESDVDAKSSTVLDMLRKVPMVTVDGNDNITVNGSSNFKVYVDGKPNQMLSSNPSIIFKNMPASAVKNIEVITNPGAKYDAEGVGGVLNLIMDKKQGNNGKINNYSATIRTMGSPKGQLGGAYVAMQHGKLSASINANIAHSKLKNVQTTTDRQQISSTGNSLMNYLQSGTTAYNVKMGNMNLGYEIDSLRLLSASFGIINFGSDIDGTAHTTMSGSLYGDGFGYKSITNTKDNRYSINGSVDYQRSFAGHKDRMFTLSYLISTTPDRNKNFGTFDADEESDYFNLSDRYTNAHENTMENTFQWDYTTLFGRKNTFDTGMKYILRDNSSHSDYYNITDGDYEWSSSNSLNYKNNNDILAAYAEMSTKLKSFNAKAGLRYEYTWQHVKYLSGQGDNFNMKYGNLVPSADVSYQLNESQNIGLAYNMRISRPGITMLNPYINRSDPSALTYGNTDLKCEKAHQINLVYNLFTMKWVVNLTLRESICDNAIEQYSFYKDNLLNTTYGNIVKNHQTGLNVYINWNAGKNTRIMINGGVSYIDLHSSALGLSNYGWQSNMMAGLQQTLPWKIRMSLNMMTATKKYSLQGWNTGFNAFIGSLTRNFIHDRLSISVSGITPLSGTRFDFKSYSKGADYVSRSCYTPPIRTCIFSISYTIGGHETVKKAKHTIQNTDVKDVKSQTEGIDNIIMK